jgi:shikimate dehydrogenase
MHNAGFAALGLPYVYVAFPCSNTVFGIGAMRELGLRGLSLTIPHKERALELMDELSKEARAIGAINTAVNDEGTLKGFNTDCYGITQALSEASFSASSALVFGAGGAARAAVYALKQLGLKALFVTNRTDSRSLSVSRDFSVCHLSWQDLASRGPAEFDLFINATPLGLASKGDTSRFPFPLSSFGRTNTVFDMVTKETELLSAARASGARVVPGIRMLLHQAVRQFELFTGERAPMPVMEEALIREYSAPAAS